MACRVPGAIRPIFCQPLKAFRGCFFPFGVKLSDQRRLQRSELSARQPNASFHHGGCEIRTRDCNGRSQGHRGSCERSGIDYHRRSRRCCRCTGKATEGEDSERQHQEARLHCCATSQSHQKIHGQKTGSQGCTGARKGLNKRPQDFVLKIPKRFTAGPLRRLLGRSFIALSPPYCRLIGRSRKPKNRLICEL